VETRDEGTGAKVGEVFRQVLRLDPVGAGSDLRLGGHPSWDSVAHIDLVLALERAFGIAFSTVEIPDLDSFDRIVSAVGRKLAARAAP